MSLPRLVPALLAVVLLAGCGDSSEDESEPVESAAPTSTTAPSAPAPSPTRKPTPKPSGPAPTTPAVTPTAAPPPAHDGPPRGAKDLSEARLPQFVNAANDTTCLFEDFEGVHVRCDVMGAQWQVQKPAACQDAYGDSVSLAEKAVLVCHGDTIFSPDVTLTLKPGQSARFQHLWCTVATSGVTCNNPAGRGFTVSKSGYRIR